MFLFLFIGKGNKVDSPIKKVITGINKNKVDYMVDAYHDYCKEDMQTRFSQDKLDTYNERVSKDMGEGVKFTYSVISSEKVSKEDLDMFYNLAIANYSQYPYLKNHDLTFDAVYNVNTEIKITGKDTSEKGNIEWFVVEIDGKYYLLDIQYNSMLHMFMN